MHLEAYRQFTQNLKHNLEADARVLGLIALGSMSDTSRTPDEWSDHDFFVITNLGEQENFRTDLSWLPTPEKIVLSIRETAHGLKVIYENAHVLEFAVFDKAELHVAKVNDYRVLLDKDGITPIIESCIADELPTVNIQKDISMVLALLIIGAGRYARGEKLSAHLFIKVYTLYHLLPALRSHLAPDDATRLDTLDAFRRFEQVFPEVGAELNQMLLMPALATAREMVNLIEEFFGDSLPDYPQKMVQVVMEYLEKLATN